MKILLAISLIFHSLIVSADICETKPFGDITNLAIPNCYKNDLYNSARKKDLVPLCEECKKNFEKLSTSKIPSLSNDLKSKLFFDAALNEYKKVVIDNLISAVKMRAVNSTGADFGKATKSCKLKTKDDFKIGCKSQKAKNLIEKSDIIQKLSNETANELAKMLSSDQNFNPRPTLLQRNGVSCNLSDQNVLSLVSTTLEESFTSVNIEKIKSLNPGDYSNIEEFFDKNSSIFNNQMRGMLKSHPLLSSQIANPQTFIGFFKTLKDTSLNAIQQKIYSPEFGKSFNEEIAKKCDDSFTKLQTLICGDDFEEGSINLDPFKNFRKLDDADFKADQEFASTESLYNKNILLLQLCDSNANKGNLSIPKNLNAISDSNPEYQKYSLKEFQSEKYDKEIGELKNFICKGDSKDCEKDLTFQCKVLAKYKSREKNPLSIDSKIASSSNPEINSLLRSMIGENTHLDPQTKSILVDQGILPKSDGTLVAQPEVPERKPENFAKAIKQEIQNTKQVAAISPAANRRSTSTHEESSSYDNHTSLSSPTSSSTAFNDDTANLQDSIRKQKQEFQDVQDEIRRRLLGEPNKKPASMSKAREIASEAFASRGRKPTPEQLNSFAEQMMSPQSDFNTPTTAQTFSGSSSGDRSTVSGGKTKAEQFREAQKQQALMGMAGAQQSALNDNAGTTSAEASKAKELAKINLNIAEDPKVTLSDIFAQKMQLNDNETQKLKELLKQNNNFVLQVKDMNFKVLFNEKNAFNLLLESGDKREAERIRPQLEIFLNRLKRNNTLHNLNQTWST